MDRRVEQTREPARVPIEHQVCQENRRKAPLVFHVNPMVWLLTDRHDKLFVNPRKALFVCAPVLAITLATGWLMEQHDAPPGWWWFPIAALLLLSGVATLQSVVQLLSFD